MEIHDILDKVITEYEIIDQQIDDDALSQELEGEDLVMIKTEQAKRLYEACTQIRKLWAHQQITYYEALAIQHGCELVFYDDENKWTWSNKLVSGWENADTLFESKGQAYRDYCLTYELTPNTYSVIVNGSVYYAIETAQDFTNYIEPALKNSMKSGMERMTIQIIKGV